MTDNFTPEKNNPAQKMSLEDWKAKKDQEKSDVFKLLDQTTLDLAEVPGCFLRYLDTQARMNRYTVPRDNESICAICLPLRGNVERF